MTSLSLTSSLFGIADEKLIWDFCSVFDVKGPGAVA